jgi:HK97 family phage prohead protease
MTDEAKLAAERVRRERLRQEASVADLRKPATTSRRDSLTLEQRRAKVTALAGHPERRAFSFADNFEVREAVDAYGDTVLRFAGYACKTGVRYQVGWFSEEIRPQAFKRCLNQGPDVQLLINHGEGGSGMPIARTGVNMTLVEDDIGLRVDAELDIEDPDVQTLARKMRSGLINQMSMAFTVAKGEQDWNEDRTERTIRAVNIHRGDVSIVNQGASPTTVATIRSLPDALRPARQADPRAVRARQERAVKELRRAQR